MPLDPPVDIASLPAAVQRVVGPAAPAPMRMMAARGASPGLRPEQIATVVAMFARQDLPHVEPPAREAAEATLAKLPLIVLEGAATSREIPPGVLDVLASVVSDDAVLEKILINPAVTAATVERLAKTGTERITEMVATNEERLLAHPSIIHALYMNKNTRMSTADRVLELAVRNGKQVSIPAFKEAAEAIVHEVIAAPDAAPTPDDILFAEAHAEGQRLEKLGVAAAEAVKEDDDGNPVVEEVAKSLEQRVREMTVSQKIRTAMLGSGATRAILVRDKNRLVAEAVVRSPLLTESEAATFAASRNVSDGVLRIIATNGDLVKVGAVKFNLVANPRTPMATALRLLGYLRSDELKKLAKSKSVSAQIAKLAKQELEKKKPGT